MLPPPRACVDEDVGSFYIRCVELDGMRVAAKAYDIEAGWVDCYGVSENAGEIVREYGLVTVAFDFAGFRGNYPVEYRLIEQYSFKDEHDLTDEEFASDHWQTLFAIQYPQITS